MLVKKLNRKHRQVERAVFLSFYLYEKPNRAFHIRPRLLVFAENYVAKRDDLNKKSENCEQFDNGHCQNHHLLPAKEQTAYRISGTENMLTFLLPFVNQSEVS